MDPRWARSLPWHRGEPGIHRSLFAQRLFPLPWSGSERDALWAYTGLVGLTVFVIVIPVGILRLVMRRLSEPANPRGSAASGGTPAHRLRIDDQIGATAVCFANRLVADFGFIIASAAGLPILAYLFVTGSILFRRRWRQLAGWFALTAVSGLMVGLFWIRIDMRSMASSEHYSWSGWYQPVVPGAYNLGALLVIAWIARGAFRFVKRLITRGAALTAVHPFLRTGKFEAVHVPFSGKTRT